MTSGPVFVRLIPPFTTELRPKLAPLPPLPNLLLEEGNDDVRAPDGKTVDRATTFLVSASLSSCGPAGDFAASGDRSGVDVLDMTDPSLLPKDDCEATGDEGDLCFALVD